MLFRSIQAAVPVYHDDTEDSLSERILEYEHLIFPYAIRLFAEGRLEVKGRVVRIQGQVKDKDVVVNPPLAKGD